MAEQLVITALGRDRSGLVNDLSRYLAKHALNIEDSRMSVLGGEFVIMLLVSGSALAIESFTSAANEVEASLEIKLLLKKTKTSAEQSSLIPYKVEVISIDHPGIVEDIARFFSSREISIVDMNTSCYPAAHTGAPMFSLHMTIGVPAEESIDILREEFIQNCDEKNLDSKIDAVV